MIAPIRALFSRKTTTCHMLLTTFNSFYIALQKKTKNPVIKLYFALRQLPVAFDVGSTELYKL